MIIDETFMWLYAAFKVGRAFMVLGYAGLPAAGFSWGMYSLHEGSIKPAVTCAVFCVLCLFIGVVLPDSEEVKAYAFYRIGSDVVDSDAAKQLFDATMNVLENKGK